MAMAQGTATKQEKRRNEKRSQTNMADRHMRSMHAVHGKQNLRLLAECKFKAP